MRKTKQKRVKLTIDHDRLTLVAEYATGGTFRFTIGRSGDRLTWGGANPAEAQTEMARFMEVAACRAGETNADRMERLKTLAEGVQSMKELAFKLKPEAVGVRKS